MQTISKNTNTDSDDSSKHKGALDELKGDASAVREDLAHLREDATKLTSHATHQAIDAVKTGAESAGDAAKSFGQNAKKYHHALCEQVSAHPSTAILLALGAGVIAGRIIGRR